ncbi:hypothetical protein N8J89_26140 [Crossiella sp. CA-258035]|uniref:hypothetical protein n=1 Tax=Crossiella sp. CA-258035 TaxID=2981138 RepID=UPI0024BCC103|nr:hypothetical protein [Crossiella sp. CA-258035]WHT16607.1 hypothetical protein N8J89_26140 [Crossiella sp. CA-258035]
MFSQVKKLTLVVAVLMGGLTGTAAAAPPLAEVDPVTAVLRLADAAAHLCEEEKPQLVTKLGEAADKALGELQKIKGAPAELAAAQFGLAAILSADICKDITSEGAAGLIGTKDFRELVLKFCEIAPKLLTFHKENKEEVDKVLTKLMDEVAKIISGTR